MFTRHAWSHEEILKVAKEYRLNKCMSGLVTCGDLASTYSEWFNAPIRLTCQSNL